MIEVRSVAQVRAAEQVAFGLVPEGALMQRAAFALASTCAGLLIDAAGGVVGARVVLLVGSGDNGGDALWAGASLAARGAQVDALLLSDHAHEGGSAALVAAGGLRHRWAATETQEHLLSDADLVVDGIVGIGGTGALRPEAAALARRLVDSSALVVAVDVPSGVDADTGMVAGEAVVADVTVTFGAVKPGLLLAPGRLHSGAVQVIDIGLAFDTDPSATVLEADDVAAWVPEPAEDAHKYRRGVVGVSAGSRAYPGAALLVSAGARHANVGMTRFLDRDDGSAAAVVTAFPDIVIDGAPPAAQGRATAWTAGSGFPGDRVDAVTVAAVLEADVPVVLDAGAITVLAEDETLRAVVADRRVRGLLTVLTPHDGECERLHAGLLVSSAGRAEAAARLAAETGAVIVLKGPGTVVVGPEGTTYIDTEGTQALSTAGSGDVLAGMIAALLAGAWATDCRMPEQLVEAVAAAVWLHGRAGRIAAEAGPVTATDIADSVRSALLSVRDSP